MGRTLIGASQEFEGVRLAGAVEARGNPSLGQDAGLLAGVGEVGIVVGDSLQSIASDFDVLIDFTLAGASTENIRICRAAGNCAVVGTTGLAAAQPAQGAGDADDRGVVPAPTLMLGVNRVSRLL